MFQQQHGSKCVALPTAVAPVIAVLTIPAQPDSVALAALRPRRRSLWLKPNLATRTPLDAIATTRKGQEGPAPTQSVDQHNLALKVLTCAPGIILKSKFQSRYQPKLKFDKE